MCSMAAAKNRSVKFKTGVEMVSLGSLSFYLKDYSLTDLNSDKINLLINIYPRGRNTSWLSPKNRY